MYIYTEYLLIHTNELYFYDIFIILFFFII